MPVVMDEVAIKRLLVSPDGIVGRAILRKTLRVQRVARELCPVGRTGALRRSINYHIGADSRGIFGLVGSPLRYAIFVHEGTGPHDIYPVNKRALYWPGAQHPVAVVHHRGGRANRFLVKALPAAFE